MALLRRSLLALLQSALCISGVASLSSAEENQQNCADVNTESLGIANTTVWFSEFIKAGTNLTFPDNHRTCSRPSIVVSKDLCRVALRVETSEQSEISLEAWLPAKWNKRFLSTGNGGWGGCIQYEDLEYTTSLGFATVGANNGHNGTSGAPFLNAPEVVKDFAWRSIHTGVVVGKQITKSFYARNFTNSYYLGCSTGGRQGMKSVQSFPGDFDGVVVGAPALAFNRLNGWSAHFYGLTGTPDSETFVPVNLWTTIVHDDIMRQCDEIDGYKDGVIEDVTLCNYRPESLICKPGQNTSTCLTGEQAGTVRKVFEPLYGENGTLVYPRMQPGSELTGAATVSYAGTPFSSDWYKYAVHNDANWDPATVGVEDYALASKLNPGNIETFEGDLSAFRDKGGKLLHYHGQEDAIITSENSPWYYSHVSRTMNLPPSELDSFYRYFKISGLAHCTGGSGASFIGQKSQANAGLEPEQNVLMAMVDWVENGKAPDTILGTAVVPGSATGSNGIGKVAFKRRHCRYPYRNVYSGEGDATDPDTWKCI
ncbi:putative feruloyl esterase B-2 [Neonectria ditissima]|uniref:Carboxylic ester hydrolase n=1 Tax=Neonectria ditissima TaxID=78410 RepID=A0A0P7BT57_9HYPO|nr:putative feruloyl esterase B-2 [Neonectria ditissima]